LLFRIFPGRGGQTRFWSRVLLLFLHFSHSQIVFSCYLVFMSAITIALEGAKQLLEEQYDAYPGSLAEALDYVLWGKEFAAWLVIFVLVRIADSSNTVVGCV
jgi:hypothetical protein